MSLADYFAVIGACGGLAMIFGLLVLRLTLTCDAPYYTGASTLIWIY